MKDGFGGKWENAQLSDGYDLHDDAMPHDQVARAGRIAARSLGLNQSKALSVM
jgi:hypothetical protein